MADTKLIETFEQGGISKNELARRLHHDLPPNSPMSYYSVRRQVTRWLNGDHVPGQFWKPLIAKALRVKEKEIWP